MPRYLDEPEIAANIKSPTKWVVRNIINMENPIGHEKAIHCVDCNHLIRLEFLKDLKYYRYCPVCGAAKDEEAEYE